MIPDYIYQDLWEFSLCFFVFALYAIADVSLQLFWPHIKVRSFYNTVRAKAGGQRPGGTVLGSALNASAIRVWFAGFPVFSDNYVGNQKIFF